MSSNSSYSNIIVPQEMKSSNRGKYLGDIISSSAKIDENIQMRREKGISIANQIISSLKEVAFGVYIFKMAMLFRTSQLASGILYNTEAMFGIKDKHVNS